MPGLLDALFGGGNPQAQVPAQAQPQSGFGRLLAPEIGLPMAAALLGGQGNMRNFANAFGAAGTALQGQNAQNKTLAFLQQNAPELAQAVGAGMPITTAWQTYMRQREAQTPGKATYSVQPIYGTDENGNTVLGTMGNDGSFKKVDTGGFNISTGVDKIDLGTHWGLIDKRSGQLVGSMPKENFQESYDKESGNQAAKIDAERPQLRSKAISTLDALDNQQTLVSDALDRTITEIENNPSMTTGLVGGLASAVPGSTAYNVAKRLETIKANIGFDKLQQMRENSPTGGALGQVSDFENRQLQSVFGSLEQAQSSDEILYNLRQLKTILANSRDARRRAFARDFDGEGAASPQGGIPGPTGVDLKTKYGLE